MVIKLYHLSVLGTEMITKVFFTFNINAPFNLKHRFLSSQGVCFLCTRFINQISWLLWQSQITTSINVAAAYQGTQKILVSSILESQPGQFGPKYECVPTFGSKSLNHVIRAPKAWQLNINQWTQKFVHIVPNSRFALENWDPENFGMPLLLITGAVSRTQSLTLQHLNSFSPTNFVV